MLRKVLIADDEADIRALISASLSRTNHGRYEVLMAEDGEEALCIAQRETPDLIISDVRMPKLNGFEVCGRLKSAPDTGHIKIFILSANASPADRNAAREAGADDYLLKPITPRELQEKVEKGLGLT